jgi:CBS-domain-containing membrane protein
MWRFVVNKLTTSIQGGVGAMLGIALLSFGQSIDTDLLLLMAPFGATAVLLFAAPQSPFSKPINVIGGHLLTALVGLLFVHYIDLGLWTIPIATGLSISLMVLTNTLHPPAGANPILIIQSQQTWFFLIDPVLLGALGLVLISGPFRKLLLQTQ